MTTTTRIPRPSWAIRSLTADGSAVDHVSRRIHLPATDSRPATSLQLVRADRIRIDDRGVAITPGQVRVEIEHLDRDVSVDHARTLLGGAVEALAALAELLGVATASTCTQCGATSAAYPSYYGPLCAGCAGRLAEHGEE